MNTYSIQNTTSGADLGIYSGETPAAALDAMSRDAGYRDHADACATTGEDGSDLRVTLVAETPVTVCPPPDAVGSVIFFDSAGREYDRHPAQTASDIARRNYDGTGYAVLYVAGRAYVHHYRGWIAAPGFIAAST